MYLYAFDRWYGHDRVAQVSGVSGSPGDLLQSGGEYFLLLGETVSFSEFAINYSLKLPSYEIIIPQLLDARTLQMVHRFVLTWFTTYKKTIPLRLGNDIAQILKRQPVKTKKKPMKGIYGQLINNQFSWQESDVYLGQQLLVAPTVLMCEQLLHQYNPQPDSIVRLHSQMTSKQKAERFWQIKYGHVTTVICTYSQMFQDWADLRQIIFLDQHAWWYKHQQEPRYQAGTCLNHMSVIYQCDLVAGGYAL